MAVFLLGFKTDRTGWENSATVFKYWTINAMETMGSCLQGVKKTTTMALPPALLAMKDFGPYRLLPLSYQRGVLSFVAPYAKTAEGELPDSTLSRFTKKPWSSTTIGKVFAAEELVPFLSQSPQSHM